MTLGNGQPGFPGYYVCFAENESEARMKTNKELNGRWCGMYECLEDIHPFDRIYLGDIL